ncbi:MAG: OmpA family protein [Acidobacteriota bacterium]|nr:MAG: OmpA family protein [Acidobacteriota bacterium]
MKKLWALFVLFAPMFLAAQTAFSQSPNDDLEGCKDYPLFNRMPNHHIIDCESIEFDARKFPVGPPLEEQRPKQVEVEGALTYLRYELNEGAREVSGVQIMRNFENAAKAAGGTVEGKYPDWCTATVDFDSRLGNTCTNWGVSMRFMVSGKEVWAYMQVTDGGYGLQIVEREAMQQDIVVNAAQLKQGLDTAGHIAVYDILFDTGKSDLKPESANALQEIADLLKGSPALKLHVVGHTDNVGDLASNMKLSQSRAAAVVAALTGQYGIASDRLAPFGVGPYSPVASNRDDEGRARNRRVELVEQ